MIDVLFAVEIDGEAIEVSVEDPGVDIAEGVDVAAIVTVGGPPGPPGPPGDGAQVFGETLSGAMDGANTVYTTAGAYRASSTAVYLNGLREFHYTESGPSELTLEDPPDSDDTLRVDYVI